jgi:signal transduction histidine kinase
MTAQDDRGSSAAGLEHEGHDVDPSPDKLEAAPTPTDVQFPDVARLELDRLLQQLRDRADDVLGTQDRLRGLLRANAAVAADLSLPVVLHRVAEAACELLGAGYAAIGVIGSDGQLEEFVHSGIPDEIVTRIGQLPRGHGILGMLIRDPTPLRLADLASHPASVGFPNDHPPMRSFLGVPIRVGDAVFGNLYVTERSGGAQFTAEDEQLAVALAVTAGGAIANARLFTESEQRRRWLLASGELTNQLLSADQPLVLITTTAALAAGADFATLAIPLGPDQLIVAAVSGPLAADLAERVAPLDASLAGRAIRTGKPGLVMDYRLEHPTIAVRVDIGPLIVVPLSAGERIRGALTLGRTADRAGFTETDLSMAASFATQAAIALELRDAGDAQLRLARVEDHDRIAADLHDHVIQELFALGMGLQGLASATDQPGHVARIVGYVDALDKVITTIRSTIFQMQTGHHNRAGLQARILDIATDHTPQLGYPPHVRFAGPLDLAVDEDLAADILAVIREAISNSARHAHATRLDISIALAGKVLILEITDNGRGLGTPTRSSGLANMRSRAERHDGTLIITTPDHGGTHLTWTANLPTPGHTT